MRMREQDDVETAHAQLGERGKDDARSDVRARRSEAAQIAAAVDQHRAASRELHEGRIPLADREEGDAQLPREAWRGRVQKARAEQGASGQQRAANARAPRRS